MLRSRHKDVGQSHDIKTANRSCDNVATFKYMGTAVTNQNSIREQIKCRLNSGNSCYLSVQNLLTSRLLYKNVNIKIYKTNILPVVLYWCETWPLTSREEHRLKIFVSRVPRIFQTKRHTIVWVWRKLHNEEVTTLISGTPCQIQLEWSSQGRWDAGNVAHTGEKRNS
jgi:hypothetical protein